MQNNSSHLSEIKQQYLEECSLPLNKNKKRNENNINQQFKVRDTKKHKVIIMT
jgi:hypothetical protein